MLFYSTIDSQTLQLLKSLQKLEILVFKSFTFFEDAEIEPMPKMIEMVDWNEVKDKII